MDKRIWIGGAVLVTAGLAFAAFKIFGGHSEAPVWKLAKVDKGELTQSITASGTLNPMKQVDVGTQVSGTVAKLYADFNSHVKAGQLIALLDTTFLKASVDDAQASLAKATAQFELSGHILDRAKGLFAKGLSAQADVDQALSDFSVAQANVTSAKAQLDRARINLAYAKIESPVNGVVVSRNVDVGQTVAASLSAPTIFVIADDLTRMQVQAGVDEGDIGQVKVGQNASFHVDAYPESTFTGVVSQIRLQPTTTQNVVTYTVMVDVGNPNLTLLPGMTANINIEIQKVNDKFIVPSEALTFKPQRPDGAKWKGHKSDNHGDTTAKKSHRENGSKVFVLRDGKPKYVPVTVALDNGTSAAIDGDFLETDSVITGVVNAKKKPAAAQTQNPFQGGGPPMGGGMPRGVK